MKDPNAPKPEKTDINDLKSKKISIDFDDNEKIKGGAAEGKKRLAEIKLGADLFRIVEQASEALTKDEAIYQREGALVMIVDKGSGPTITSISRATLKERLSRVADFLVKKEEEAWSSVKPPQDVVDALYDRKQWPGIRFLVGLREAPFLRPDGSVCQKLGYDEKTRFILATSVRFPHIPESPSQKQALECLKQLLDIVCDFPFASDEHRVSWLALVLTLFGRCAIDGPCPVFAVDANTRGSGKTRLVDLVSILLTGKEAPRTIQTDNEEEMRKRALACYIGARPLTLIDNVRGILGGATLEGATTGSTFEERLLGTNENLILPALTVWTCTGNNLTFTDDMGRRVLPIRLESELENPESRSDFKIPSLLSWVKQHRAELVAAVLTMWRAWFVAGRPHSEDLTLWGSFEEWSALLLPIISWLDLPSPMSTHEALTKNDSSKGTIYSFLAELANALQREKLKDISVREILEKSYPTQTLSSGGYAAAQALRSVVEDLCGIPNGKQPSAKQLAAALRRYKGRRIHDLRIMCEEDRKGVARWSVAVFKD
jgi:hypothetical protein